MFYHNKKATNRRFSGLWNFIIVRPINAIRKIIPIIPVPASMKSTLNNLKKILPFFWPKNSAETRELIKAGAVITGTIGLNSALPILFREICRLIVAEEKSTLDVNELHQQFLFGLVLAFGFGWTTSQISYAARRLLMNKISDNAVQKFNMETMQKISVMSHQMHHSIKPDVFIGALQRAGNSTAQICNELLINLTPMTGEIFFNCIALSLQYSKYYGLGAVCVLSLCASYSLLTMDLQNEAEKESQNLNRKVDESTAHLVKDFEKIHYHHAWETELTKHQQLLTKAATTNHRKNILFEITPSGQSIILGLALTLMLNHLRDCKYSVEDFNILNLYMLSLVNGAYTLSWALTNLRKSLTNVDEALSMLEVEPTQQSCSELEVKIKSESMLQRINRVNFDQVDLNYAANPQSKVLQGISLEFLPNTITALVGKNGSGKSSLTRLLFRFYEPSAGKILVNNMDISTFSLSQYRQKVTIAAHTKIMPGTLYENLIYGTTPKSFEVDRLVKKLGLSVFIAGLKEGLETDMQQLNLSDGQLQKLGVVRALLQKDSLIYVFDEVTSALDPDSKNVVMDCIKEETNGKIVIMISHDFNIVAKYSDRVVVLQEGKVAQLGTHAELSEQAGPYRQLYLEESHSAFPKPR